MKSHLKAWTVSPTGQARRSARSLRVWYPQQVLAFQLHFRSLPQPPSSSHFLRVRTTSERLRFPASERPGAGLLRGEGPASDCYGAGRASKSVSWASYRSMWQRSRVLDGRGHMRFGSGRVEDEMALTRQRTVR